MLKIRLRRMGSRHRPFYRVVVSDSRQVPTASAVEELGMYNPTQKPAVFRVDLDRLDHWVAQGAQPSSTLKKLVAKARKGAFEPAAEAAEEAPAPTKKEEAKKTEAKKEEAKTEEAAPAEAESETTEEAAPAEDAAPAEAAAEETTSAEAPAEAAETEEAKKS